MRALVILVLFLGISATAHASFSNIFNGAVNFAATSLSKYKRQEISSDSSIKDLCGTSDAFTGFTSESMCAAYVDEYPDRPISQCNARAPATINELLLTPSEVMPKRGVAPAEDVCRQDLLGFPCFVQLTGAVLRGTAPATSMDALNFGPDNFGPVFEQDPADAAFYRRWQYVVNMMHNFYSERLPIIIANGQLYLLQQAALITGLSDLDIHASTGMLVQPGPPKNPVAPGSAVVYNVPSGRSVEEDAMLRATENLGSLCSCICA